MSLISTDKSHKGCVARLSKPIKYLRDLGLDIILPDEPRDLPHPSHTVRNEFYRHVFKWKIGKNWSDSMAGCKSWELPGRWRSAITYASGAS